MLAAAGLYGVLTAIALQDRREIGVRMAIGATWIDILRLMLGRGLAVVGAGVCGRRRGIARRGRLLASFLVSVSPADPWAIGGAALVLTLVALPACLIPARRAANTSPDRGAARRVRPATMPTSLTTTSAPCLHRRHHGRGGLGEFEVLVLMAVLHGSAMRPIRRRCGR